MFDLGWQEIFVIGTVTLIVVGPRDLPNLLNKVGKALGKIRQVSREFFDQINEAAEIEEINKLKKDLSEYTELDNLVEDPSMKVRGKKSVKAKQKKIASRSSNFNT